MIDYTEILNLFIVFILSQNFIYFGNNESPTIDIYDKMSLRHISSYRLNGPTVGGITDMAMFASDVQPSSTCK